MTNEEKAKELGFKFFPDEENIWARGNVEAIRCASACLEMAQWKDEQFKQQLNSLKNEIQSNLCASSGFNDEYSRRYQDCGMKVMEMIDKILNK